MVERRKVCKKFFRFFLCKKSIPRPALFSLRKTAHFLIERCNFSAREKTIGLRLRLAPGRNFRRPLKQLSYHRVGTPIGAASLGKKLDARNLWLQEFDAQVCFELTLRWLMASRPSPPTPPSSLWASALDLGTPMRNCLAWHGNMHSSAQELKGSRAQELKGSRTQDLKDSSVQGFKGSRA